MGEGTWEGPGAAGFLPLKLYMAGIDIDKDTMARLSNYSRQRVSRPTLTIDLKRLSIRVSRSDDIGH